MRRSLQLGGILFTITALIGLILGIAYKITEKPIKQAQLRQRQEAMRMALPAGEVFKKKDMDLPEDGNISEVNEAYSGDKLIGYDISVSTSGYGGTIKMIVGISSDGRVEGLRILSHSETPGLGANAAKPAFSGQFEGKNSSRLDVVKVAPSKDDQIQAISGATITSRAVTKGVNEALSLYDSRLKGESK